MQPHHHDLNWRTSSACTNNNCVEVASTGDSIAIRSSLDPHGATIVYSAEEWRDFVVGVKRGEFDNLLGG